MLVSVQRIRSMEALAARNRSPMLQMENGDGAKEALTLERAALRKQVRMGCATAADEDTTLTGSLPTCFSDQTTSARRVLASMAFFGSGYEDPENKQLVISRYQSLLSDLETAADVASIGEVSHDYLCFLPAQVVHRIRFASP